MLESFKNNLFTYEKLSEEEQTKRGILGRLVGVIADSKNPTRNGRLYSETLWENVFNNPIMKEKIENRCCFGELGHPTDREEVDPEKIAICLAEQPKVNGKGQLCGVFDILSTPCGKILKTLCDYGCTIGVSSRGSGDIMENDEVDPDTYYCECWDAVLIPAVKTARMQFVTESLEQNKKSLKVALKESYDAANDEDKKAIKESLDNLDIKLDIESDEKLDECDKALAEEEVEYEDPDAVLVEEAEEEAVEEVSDDAEIALTSREEALNVLEDKIDIQGEDETIVIAEKGQLDNPEAPKIEVEVSEEEKEILEPEFHEDKKEEKPAEEINDYPLDENLKEADEDKSNVEPEAKVVDGAYTVGAMINQFKDYDNDLAVEFKPIVVDDKELEVTHLEFDDSEDGKVIISIGYDPVKDDNIEEVNSEEKAEIEVADPATEEAIDNGDEEVMESLKEAVRQKDLLEKEIRDLKNQKTVSDTEVDRLKEELNKYKSGFVRVSELAANTGKLKKENKSLKEQLALNNVKLTNLQTKLNTQLQLKESVDANEAKVKSLAEKLETFKLNAENTEKELTEQLATAKKMAQTRLAAAKTYKSRYEKVVEKYIASKAEMLGVRSVDITSKLTENYSLEDIDKICNDLLNEGRPKFGLSYGASMQINESKGTVSKKHVSINPDDGYEIDDDLLMLAGLK